MAITVEMRTQISQLYVALFGRAPDAEGLSFWVQKLDAGESLVSIANQMFATEPARAYYPGFLTNQEIIASFYVNVLGRTADAEGLAFWTAKLNAAGATPGSVINEMVSVVANYVANGGSDPAGLVSAALFNNKVAVAQFYGEHAGNIADATVVLATVTADVATVAAAELAIANGTIGQDGIDVSLTADQNTVNGTTATDVVHGIFGAADKTVTAGDTIDLGAGTQDQLALVANGPTANDAIVVKNTEFINITDTVGATFNALLVENAPAITFTNTQAGLTSTVTNASLSSTYGIAGKGNLTVDFLTTTGTADNAMVAVNGVGTSTTARSTIDVSDGNTVEKVTLATAGTNFVTLNAGTGAGTITVTGSGTNNITVGSAKTTATIDASASTGTNTFNLGTQLSNGDVVKGGTGTDTVSFNATTAVGGVTFTGVEKLSADFDADVALNLGTTTGLNSITMTGSSGSATILGAKSDLTAITISSVATGDTDNDLAVSYATGQSGTLALTIGGATAITMDEIELTRVGSLTLNAVGDLTLTSDTLLDATTTSVAINVDDEVFVDMGSIYAENAADTLSSLSNLSINVGEAAGFSAGTVYAYSGGSGDQGEAITVNITTGDESSAYLDGVSGVAFGDITATVGASASAYFGDFNASGGDIGNVSLTVGESGSGYLSAYASGYSADGDTGGNIGNVTLMVHASGSGSISALASGWHSGGAYKDGGMIGDVSITASGQSAYASGYIYASSGNIGDTTIIVAGQDAGAYVYEYAYDDNSGGPDGDIGNAAIAVAGESAYVDAQFDASGAIGNLALNVGDGASAWVSGYGYSGDAGSVVAEIGNEAYVSADWYSYSGDMGGATITMGDDSSGIFYFEGKSTVGAVTVTAGNGSDTYVSVTEYAGSNAGAVTLTGGEDGDAYVYVSAGQSDGVYLGGWLGSATIDVSAVGGSMVVTGGAGGNSITGTGYADVLTGGALADTITAGAGADVVIGAAGKDTLDGGAGSDQIDGGAGKDTMTGGSEADTFVFTGSNLGAGTAFSAITTSTDVVTDFTTTSDKFDFPTAGSATNYAENTTGVADLATLLAAADTALNGTVQYYFGVVTGGPGYLVYSVNGTTALAVVELTAVTDMAYTDIV